METDITNMHDIPDELFDVFVAIAVLPHVEKSELAVDEVFRVLRPEGKVIIQASNHKNPTFAYPDIHAHH